MLSPLPPRDPDAVRAAYREFLRRLAKAVLARLRDTRPAPPRTELFNPPRSSAQTRP